MVKHTTRKPLRGPASMHISRNADSGALEKLLTQRRPRRTESESAQPTDMNYAKAVVRQDLVTMAALAAMGDDDQLDFYLAGGSTAVWPARRSTEALTHPTDALTAVTRTVAKY